MLQITPSSARIEGVLIAIASHLARLPLLCLLCASFTHAQQQTVPDAPAPQTAPQTNGDTQQQKIQPFTSEVIVTSNAHEIAQAQLSIEEHQRVLGIVPNFFVSYSPNPAPLSPGQKFQLALRNEIDPVTYVATGITAGIEQADRKPKEWEQGASGYGKRYAAAYGDDLIDTMLGAAVFPSLFHQDPRYFYKGTGSVTQRTLYAIRSTVICKSDGGQWQFNYSSLMGDLGAAGISDAYYPRSYRNGFGSILTSIAIAKAVGAGQNILQEFVVRRLTPHAP